MQPVVERSDVAEVFAIQKKAFLDDPNPDWATRADRLKRMRAMVRRYKLDFAEAIESDFGVRDARETLLAEVVPAGSGCDPSARGAPSSVRSAGTG